MTFLPLLRASCQTCWRRRTRATMRRSSTSTRRRLWVSYNSEPWRHKSRLPWRNPPKWSPNVDRTHTLNHFIASKTTCLSDGVNNVSREIWINCKNVLLKSPRSRAAILLPQWSVFSVVVWLCVSVTSLCCVFSSWGCLILMVTASSASLRWRGEIPAFFFAFVWMYVWKPVLIHADETPSSLSFYRRLLPVHENFLLKFEVRFSSHWFLCTSTVTI